MKTKETLTSMPRNVQRTSLPKLVRITKTYDAGMIVAQESGIRHTGYRECDRYDSGQLVPVQKRKHRVTPKQKRNPHRMAENKKKRPIEIAGLKI